MSTLTARRRIVPPHWVNSFEEARETRHSDLPDMTAGELAAELVRVARLVRRDPRAFVWVGPHEFVTVGTWASERVSRIHDLLNPGAGFTHLSPAPPRPEPTRPKPKVVGSWNIP